MTSNICPYSTPNDLLLDQNYTMSAVQNILYFPSAVVFNEGTALYGFSFNPQNPETPIGGKIFHKRFQNAFILSTCKRDHTSFLCLTATATSDAVIPAALDASRGGPGAGVAMSKLISSGKLATSYSIYSTDGTLRYSVPTLKPTIAATTIEGTPFILSSFLPPFVRSQSRHSQSLNFAPAAKPCTQIESLVDSSLDNAGYLSGVKLVQNASSERNEFSETRVYPAINHVFTKPALAINKPSVTADTLTTLVNFRSSTNSDVLFTVSAIHVSVDRRQVQYREYEFKRGAMKTQRTISDEATLAYSFKPTVYISKCVILRFSHSVLRSVPIVVGSSPGSLFHDTYGVVLASGELQVFSRVAAVNVDRPVAVLPVFSHALTGVCAVSLKENTLALLSSQGEMAIVGVEGRWNSDKALGALRTTMTSILTTATLTADQGVDSQDLKDQLSRAVLPPIADYSMVAKRNKNERLSIVTRCPVTLEITCAAATTDGGVLIAGSSTCDFIVLPVAGMKNRALLNTYYARNMLVDAALAGASTAPASAAIRQAERHNIDAAFQNTLDVISQTQANVDGAGPELQDLFAMDDARNIRPVQFQNLKQLCATTDAELQTLLGLGAETFAGSASSNPYGLSRFINPGRARSTGRLAAAVPGVGLASPAAGRSDRPASASGERRSRRTYLEDKEQLFEDMDRLRNTNAEEYTDAATGLSSLYEQADRLLHRRSVDGADLRMTGSGRPQNVASNMLATDPGASAGAPHPEFASTQSLLRDARCLIESGADVDALPQSSRDDADVRQTASVSHSQHSSPQPPRLQAQSQSQTRLEDILDAVVNDEGSTGHGIHVESPMRRGREGLASQLSLSTVGVSVVNTVTDPLALSRRRSARGSPSAAGAAEAAGAAGMVGAQTPLSAAGHRGSVSSIQHNTLGARSPTTATATAPGDDAVRDMLSETTMRMQEAEARMRGKWLHDQFMHYLTEKTDLQSLVTLPDLPTDEKLRSYVSSFDEIAQRGLRVLQASELPEGAAATRVVPASLDDALELLLHDDTAFSVAATALPSSRPHRNHYYSAPSVASSAGAARACELPEHAELASKAFSSLFWIGFHRAVLTASGETEKELSGRFVLDVLPDALPDAGAGASAAHATPEACMVRGCQAFFDAVFESDFRPIADGRIDASVTGGEPSRAVQAVVRFVTLPARLVAFVRDQLVYGFTLAQASADEAVQVATRYTLVGAVSDDFERCFACDERRRWCEVTMGADPDAPADCPARAIHRTRVSTRAVQDLAFYAMYAAADGGAGAAAKVCVTTDTVVNFVKSTLRLQKTMELVDEIAGQMAEKENEIDHLRSRLDGVQGVHAGCDENTSDLMHLALAKQRAMEDEIDRLRTDNEQLRATAGADSLLISRSESQRDVERSLRAELQRYKGLAATSQSASSAQETAIANCLRLLGDTSEYDTLDDALRGLQQRCSLAARSRSPRSPGGRVVAMDPGSMTESLRYSRMMADKYLTKSDVRKSRASLRDIAASLGEFSSRLSDDLTLDKRSLVATSVLPVLCFIMGVGVVILFAMAFTASEYDFQ